MSLSREVNEVVVAAMAAFGLSSPTAELRWAAHFALMGVVVPWLGLILASGGRPYDLGFRRPNRVGWRVLFVGYVVSVPFLVWMARGSDFAAYYLPQLRRAGMGAFLLYYFVSMVSEHFFFHGLLLAACRSGHRWPGPPPVATAATGRIRRVLQWIGLAQPTHGARGVRRCLAWMGLPQGCVPAICTSALLFAAIHIGKAPREVVLSLPGGLAMAYMAYRTNTWLVPLTLHLATAGTACLLIVGAR